MKSSTNHKVKSLNPELNTAMLKRQRVKQVVTKASRSKNKRDKSKKLLNKTQKTQVMIIHQIQQTLTNNEKTKCPGLPGHLS
jgi:hypothetical protein